MPASRFDIKWNKQYNALAKYKKKNGNCSVTCKEDTVLANWAYTQRHRLKSGKLSHERIEKLDKLGFVYKLRASRLERNQNAGQMTLRDKQWQGQFHNLKSFHSQHGHFKVHHTPRDDRSFYNWVLRQRNMNTKGTLRKDRFDQLDSIGFFGDDDGSELEEESIVEDDNQEENESEEREGRPAAIVSPGIASTAFVRPPPMFGRAGEVIRQFHHSKHTSSLVYDNNNEGSDDDNDDDGSDDYEEVLPPHNIVVTGRMATCNHNNLSPSSIVLDSTTYRDAMKNANEMIQILKYEKDDLQRDNYNLKIKVRSHVKLLIALFVGLLLCFWQYYVVLLLSVE